MRVFLFLIYACFAKVSIGTEMVYFIKHGKNEYRKINKSFQNFAISDALTRTRSLSVRNLNFPEQPYERKLPSYQKMTGISGTKMNEIRRLAKNHSNARKKT